MSDREGEISYDIPYMWNLKRNDTNELTYKTERDSQTQKRNLWLLRGRDSEGLWEGQVHIDIFKMNTNKHLFYSTWNSAQCYVPA